MNWKERLYASIPPILVILGAAGVVVTNEAWVAIVALAGAWLLPQPVNVSRETSKRLPSESALIHRDIREVEDRPQPCHELHGSADAHVLGCEGWRNPPL